MDYRNAVAAAVDRAVVRMARAGADTPGNPQRPRHLAEQRRADHLDHRVMHRHLLAARRRRRRKDRRTARVDHRNLADGDWAGRQRLRAGFRRAARMPRARRRRLWPGNRAARHADDAMVRRRRVAVHQYGQLLLRLRRTHRGVPRDAGPVRGRRLVADDAVVVRRRLGRRRAVVDNLRPRASRRCRRAGTQR